MYSSPLVSIIVPVYNTEKYIKTCLDSLLGQTLQDIEIICIDDGSTDNSLNILDNYKEKYTNILIINQKNSGQGSARNRGIEKAQGKYILFLDSDDYLDVDACRALYEKAECEKTNIINFNTKIVWDIANISEQEKTEFNKNTKFNKKYKGNIKICANLVADLDVNCWDKFFNRKFLIDNNIKFPEKIRYEDVEFFWKWISVADYIYFFNKQLHFYVRRENSFISQIKLKQCNYIHDSFYVVTNIKKWLIDKNKYDLFEYQFLKLLEQQLIWGINSIGNGVIEQQKLVDDYSTLISYNYNYDDKNLERFLINLKNKDYYYFKIVDRHDTTNIVPHFGINQCTCVFAVDHKYLPYLSVTINSIIQNITSNHEYELIVLYSDLNDYERRFLINQTLYHDNIHISFYNMNSFLNEFGVKAWFVNNHISTAAYYRLFVGKIFYNFKKILYLDSDLIVNTDISKLFYIDLKDKTIGACIDFMLLYYPDINFYNYMQSTFSFHRFDKYFNSGVLLINIEKFNQLNFDFIISLIHKNTDYFHDQNILNVLFENNYLCLDYTWNVLWYVDQDFIKKHSEVANIGFIRPYLDYNNLPCIVHYCSYLKPWNVTDKAFADLWWKYARSSPFYESFIKNLVIETHCDYDIKQISYKDSIKIFKYKLLSHVLFGKKREHYIEKLKKYKH